MLTHKLYLPSAQQHTETILPGEPVTVSEGEEGEWDPPPFSWSLKVSTNAINLQIISCNFLTF